MALVYRARGAVACLAVLVLSYFVSAASATACDLFLLQSGELDPESFMGLTIDYAWDAWSATPELETYLSGSYHANAVDLLTNSSALTIFKTRMKNWLGIQLQCTDGGIPWNETAHPPGRPLAEVHGSMGVFSTHFTTFNEILVSMLDYSMSGTTPDQLQEVRDILNGHKSDIVFRTTTCDRLGDDQTLEGSVWVNNFADTFLTNVSSPASPFAAIFNGTRAGGNDYTSNSTLRADLATRYGSYLGHLSAFNCSNVGSATIDFNALIATHAPLNIAEAEFNLYVAILLDTLRAQGATTGDIIAISSAAEDLRAALVSALPVQEPPSSSSSSPSALTTEPQASSPFNVGLSTPDAPSSGTGPARTRHSLLAFLAVMAISAAFAVLAL